MNIKTTCKECGQLRDGAVKVLQSGGGGTHEIIMCLRGEAQPESSLLDVFAQSGVQITKKGDNLHLTVPAMVTDEPEEATATPEPPAPEIAPKPKPKRRARPATPKDD